MVQDHKPEAEVASGRLKESQVYSDEMGCYLSAEVEGEQPHRLAVSRSLGDFDLTGAWQTQKLLLYQDCW